MREHASVQPVQVVLWVFDTIHGHLRVFDTTPVDLVTCGCLDPYGRSGLATPCYRFVVNQEVHTLQVRWAHGRAGVPTRAESVSSHTFVSLSASLGALVRVMFICGHGYVVLGLCFIDAVRQPSLFYRPD